MNPEINETSELYGLLFKLAYKIKLKKSDQYVTLSNISMYCIRKNVKKSCKNNTLETSALTWNEELDLPDGSYSVSDISG